MVKLIDGFENSAAGQATGGEYVTTLLTGLIAALRAASANHDWGMVNALTDQLESDTEDMSSAAGVIEAAVVAAAIDAL